MPGLPSADEVRSNGLFLSQTISKLLQKIEELTVYTIQEGRENIIQDTLIDNLKLEIEQLKKEISLQRGEIKHQKDVLGTLRKQVEILLRDKTLL